MNENKTTMWCSVASLLAASMLMGGCMADAGGEGEGVSAEGSNVAASEELGEATQAINECGFLYPGETLFAGQAKYSCDGRFMLTVQTDGNLVLYGPVGAIWATFTSGAGNRLAMQSDGNLVLYTSDYARRLWSTNTATAYYGYASKFAVQNDGNMVVYDNVNYPVWSSATNFACRLFKGTGTDGNLYSYKKCGWNASWLNNPSYPGYQEPLVGSERPWNGGWASTNNHPVVPTNSAATVNSFIAGTYAYGECSQCVQ
ncbi:MAG TPA: hypothetical protein VFZ09_40105 [Archangium sp.]|uniref:hypothetical protein n=1 Tax=Archangium sp. TaxID=1872627 RepID=UPI002E3260C8|nr:hypothetical protein [Archangium sp.]HEX5752478.1 hypothetical protein [Archangium sp.]